MVLIYTTAEVCDERLLDEYGRRTKSVNIITFDQHDEKDVTLILSSSVLMASVLREI